MNRSVEKIHCPNCEADNFASSPVCWKCGEHIKTRPVPLPFLLTPSTRRKPNAGKKAAVRPVNLGIFLSFYAIPVIFVLLGALSLFREVPIGLCIGVVFTALSAATVHAGYKIWRGIPGARKDLTILLTLNGLYSLFKLIIVYSGSTFAQSLAFASAVPWREWIVLLFSAAFLVYLYSKEMRDYCAE